MRALRGTVGVILSFAIAAGCGSSGDSGTTDGGGDSDADVQGADGSTQLTDGGSAGSSDSPSQGYDSSSSPSPAASDGGTTVTRTIDSRPYRVFVPNGYAMGTAIPLLVLLHGYAESSSTIESYFGIDAVAANKGFLLALPEGTKDDFGLQFWNADDACCDLNAKHPNDVGYLHDLIVDMKAGYTVDPKRVFVAGHSAGGFMAHRMACDHTDEIAAIMSLAGMVWLDATKCVPSGPISVLQVHGDADTIVNYNGGLNPGGSYPSAPVTISTWATKNGCDATLTDTGKTLDLDSSLAGAETNIKSHSCTNGAAELWTIKGGAHIPQFQPAWAETFYSFLAAHPKP